MLQSALGLTVLVGLSWLMSENRRAVSVRVIVVGLLLQFSIAILFIKNPSFIHAMNALNDMAGALEKSTAAGTAFAFGFLGGGPLPYAETAPGASYVFAFRALPLILIMSVLSSLLFYWRILPILVRAFSLLFQRTMRVGGALGLSVAVNIFVGMVEAPLVIKPYLLRLTRSEFFAMMVAGMGGIAGTVLLLYVSILRNVVPDVLGHILIASVISAPASILLAQVMIPETQTMTADGDTPPQVASSSMDAITQGTAEGLTLVLNVTAMLIVLTALVALANEILHLLPAVAGGPLSLQRIGGWVMSPLAWLLGVPWAEAQAAGALLGTKVILNEMLAYIDMAALPEGALSERSRVIMTYALCGFANLASLGIMIGGLRAMCPERSAEIISLGPRTVLAGLFATCMTGAVIGVLY